MWGLYSLWCPTGPREQPPQLVVVLKSQRWLSLTHCSLQTKQSVSISLHPIWAPDFLVLIGFNVEGNYISLCLCTTLPKYLAEEPSSLKTVTTPGLRTCRVGTCAGRIPNAPVSVGTSTCFTLAALKKTWKDKTQYFEKATVEVQSKLSV